MEVLFSKFHPLLVHFPIVISLILGFCLFFKEFKKEGLLKLQLLNCLFLFLAGLSGYLLFDKVEMESPSLLDHKEIALYVIPFLFIITLCFLYFKNLKDKKNIIRGAVLLQILGVSYISYLGADSHYGEFHFEEKSTTNLLKFHHSYVSIYELETKVMPILKSRCVKCHRGKEAARELRMDDPVHFLLGLERNKLITGCDKNKSEFFKRLTVHSENKKIMPLNRGLLSKWELKVIGDWIEKSCRIPSDIYKELDHWSFKKIEKPLIDSSYRGHPIDYFLETSKAKKADKKIIQNRIYSSLTGMLILEPHSSVKKVIEKSLSSKAFGERMASYWLRLHRYADSVGGDRDSYRFGAYQYRDYLIKALNQDRGLNKILFGQLAGDLIVDQRDLGATGFHLVGEINPGESGESLIETKLVYADDVIGSTFSVNLGLDTRCARCHDHRSNPLTQKQYYELTVPFLPIEDEFLTIDEFNKDEKKLDEIKKLKEKNKPEYTNKMRKLFEDHRELKYKTREDLSSSFVRLRGDPYKLGERVKFALPDFYEGAKNDLAFWEKRLDQKKILLNKNKKQRAVLAEWMTDANSGVGFFTARNIVNHFWTLFFGRSLIDKPSDQNFSSSKPKQIELLNYLAFYLVENNWSLKKLVNFIVTSRAFQVLEIGEEEFETYEYFYPVPKFPGEVRDQVLQLAGLLNPKMYGPGVQPKLPSVFKIQVIAGNWNPVYEEKESYRKSIYLFKKRSLLTSELAFLGQLPSAEPKFGIEGGNNRNEVFYFKGSKLLKEASRKIAQAHSGSKKSHLKIFNYILRRGPDEEELESIQDFVENAAKSNTPKDESIKSFTQSLLSLNELRFIF